jgi:hypothetical protein
MSQYHGQVKQQGNCFEAGLVVVDLKVTSDRTPIYTAASPFSEKCAKWGNPLLYIAC